ncbi:hypothetical protein ASG52_18800 [Methylobacterium sp. Leaf456]|uniref:AraC family transcriptional regulator n=1 Tax=Methylobacterium sp. Leaf456 TaxID=1736382 RepID=UPI0006F2D567|nr:AraC family transcriptional regulator [Methylobacterium sp. Leaf456]KQT60167.1 hypothetical protein ASG52_18800 [Methylobacterium sp. Leaf456]
MSVTPSLDHVWFDLTDVPHTSRQKVWKDTLNAFFYEYDFDLPSDFANGEIEGCYVGDLSIARVESDAMTVQRTPSHISRDALDAYFVLLPLGDPILLGQRGREAAVRGNQFALVSTSDTYSYVQDTYTQFNNLIVPGAVVRQYAPQIDDIVAQASQDGALVRMFTGFANSFAKGLHELDPSARAAAGRHIVELLGLVLDGGDYTSGAAPVRFAHRRRILQVIEQGYPNPAFGIDAIAATLRLSKRYIQAVFAADNETVGDVICRRRIAEARRLLALRQANRATVKDIASSVGFLSLSHFSCVFKAETGVAPTEFADAPPNDAP